MRNGTEILILDNIEEVYKNRGWEYIPHAHDHLKGKEAIITNIEPKYSHDYIMTIELKEENSCYHGTLPVECVKVLQY